MRTLMKGCLAAVAIIIVVPVLFGLTLYFAGASLMRRNVESPPITPAQIQNAQTKVGFAPHAGPNKLTFTETDLNALLQQAIDENPNLKRGHLTLSQDSIALEVAAVLPANSTDFPVLLRNFAGKEVGIYLEITTSVEDGNVYLAVKRAAIGQIPLPVATLLALAPEEWKSNVNYTQKGVNLTSLVENGVNLKSVEITEKGLIVDFSTK